MTLLEAEELLWEAHSDVSNPKEALKQAAITIHDSLQDELTWEHMATTNANGHLIEFPQFGRFKPNTMIVIYSREILDGIKDRA
jgi:hypothetical protein